MEADFRSIGIIGLGLLGGSIAKTLRHKGYRGLLVGIDSHIDALGRAYEAQVFDSLSTVASYQGQEVDLLVLAVPVNQVIPMIEGCSSLIGSHTLVTDVASVKSKICSGALGCKGTFIGGHPMAGSEKSGWQGSSHRLFEGVTYFITPEGEGASAQNLAGLDKLVAFVRFLGAIPLVKSPLDHDAIVAAISHLPHVAACALTSAITKATPSHHMAYGGGGLKDTTRIAMANCDMWQEILLGNSHHVAKAIGLLIIELEGYKELILTGNAHALVDQLGQSKHIRLNLEAQYGS